MKMKIATLLILLPATAANSQSVNQARSNNPNLRGGGAVRKQSHRHEGHSLLEEFRQQRAHKKDIEDDTADDIAEQVVADNAGELIVGPGKYSDPVDVHPEKSPVRNNKAHPAVFQTSRLSRGEMEKRAYEMETKLQQVEEGTLQLNEKTVDRYKKFVDRYNELEKEIHLMNHPEEKEAEDEDTTNIGDAAEEEEKSTSAYSSGKAEYEKSIEQMKEKKEHDVLMKVMEGDGEGKITEKATSAEKKAEYVYAADGTKQLRVMDDDEINQLDKPDESGNKGGEDNLEAVSESSMAEDDDIPPNFEGLSEGKMTNTAEWGSTEEIGSKGGDDNLETVSKGGEPSTAEDDDDIPPNFEGLSEGKMTNDAEKSSRTEVVRKEGDDNLETVTTGGESSTAEDDDIPPNFEGLAEGKMTTNTAEKAFKEEIVGSEETSDAAEDDDIPPNFEGLGGGGKDSLVVSEGATTEEEPEANVVATRQRGDDKIPADISVEDSLEKVKKVADVVNTPDEVSKKSIENVKTVQTDENDDTGEAPLADGKAVDAMPLKEEGDDGSDDAGTEEMDKALLPKTSEGLKSSERAMNVDGEER